MGCMLFSTDLRLSLKKKVDAQAMTVGCPSNSRRASSISALPAPAGKTSAGGTASRSSMWPALTARTHQLYLCTQGSASLLRTKKKEYSPC